MRIITILFIFLITPTYAQLLDELGVCLGPKMEFNSAGSPAIEIQPHVDASFNIYLTHKLNQSWRIHALVGQRNFSAKYQVSYMDPWLESEQTYFRKTVQAQFTSTQLAVFPSYSVLLDPRWEWWAGAGLQFYLSRSLDEENPGPLVDYVRDANNDPISNSTLLLYENGLGPGNFFIRAETGIIRHFSDRLSLEASLYGLTSSLEHHSFRIQVLDADGQKQVDHRITNGGNGIGLNIGIRIQLQAPTSNEEN